jgi:hypothetical protein
MTDDRGQRTDGRRQRTDGRRQMTEALEFGIGNAECGIE